MPCLSRPYPLKFFKGCLPQNLFSPMLITLSQIRAKKVFSYGHLHLAIYAQTQYIHARTKSSSTCTHKYTFFSFKISFALLVYFRQFLYTQFTLHIYSTEHYRQTNTYIQAISEPQSRIHFKDICVQTNRHQLFGHNHIKQRRSGRIETFAETKRD